MSLESDGSDVIERLAGVMTPPALMSATPTYAGTAAQRRMTSVFVVTPSEVTQLGWYHTLHHAEDLLLVGTGRDPSDATAAIRDGWADLVLVDVSTDDEAGFGIERDLLECPITAKYLFTSGEARPAVVPGALSTAMPQTIGGASPMLYTRCGVDLLLADLRRAVDTLFDIDPTDLRTQRVTSGSATNRNLMIARARGAQK